MDLEAYINYDPELKALSKTTSNVFGARQQSELKKRGNFLLRQELNDYTPECTMKFILFYHIAFGLLCLGFAIPIILPQDGSFSEIQYDQCNIKEYNDADGKPIKYCNVVLTLSRTLKPPIFVYYRLDNYYSNHREYVKSKIYDQLRGEAVKESLYASYCDKVRFNSDLFGSDAKRLRSFTGQPLEAGAYLNPCGLIAASMFNDTFRLINSGNATIEINETGISSDTDRRYMFKRDSKPDLQWVDVENEHFIVWMSMELLPNFIKKWGHIDTVLPEGNYTLKIDWNWNSNGFGTGRYFILSEGQTLGTEPLFGYILLSGTFLSLVIIVSMLIKRCQKEKKFNQNALSWD